MSKSLWGKSFFKNIQFSFAIDLYIATTEHTKQKSTMNVGQVECPGGRGGGLTILLPSPGVWIVGSWIVLSVDGNDSQLFQEGIVVTQQIPPTGYY